MLIFPTILPSSLLSSLVFFTSSWFSFLPLPTSALPAAPMLAVPIEYLVLPTYSLSHFSIQPLLFYFSIGLSCFSVCLSALWGQAAFFDSAPPVLGDGVVVKEHQRVMGWWLLNTKG